MHHKLNHPNIIKLLNYYYEKEKNTTYMVLEYASGGSLNEKIKFGYGQLSKQLVKRYFRDICDAVRYHLLYTATSIRTTTCTEI